MSTQTQPNGSARTEVIPPAPTTSLALMGTTMSPALQIMLDDRLFERTKQIATYLSKAEGFIPPHLIGKAEACFAVVTRALTWKLDPFAVAQSTYQTPGGRVGYEGKLCQAILENSGQLEGGVKYEFYGDWSKVQGKFEIKTSQKGNQYPAPTWTRADAKGVGVIVRAKVRGEDTPREWRFDLEQAFPLNSTLWATDPKTQICYTAVRRFASVAAPALFMGVPFDRDDDLYYGAENAKDVTPPRPTREEYRTESAAPATSMVVEPEPEVRFEYVDADGNPVPCKDDAEFCQRFIDGLRAAPSQPIFEGIWETNSPALGEIRKMEGGEKLATDVHDVYREKEAAFDKARAAEREDRQERAAQAAEPTRRQPIPLEKVGVRPNLSKYLTAFQSECDGAQTEAELSEVWDTNWPTIQKLSDGTQGSLKLIFAKRKAALNAPAGQ